MGWCHLVTLLKVCESEIVLAESCFYCMRHNASCVPCTQPRQLLTTGTPLMPMIVRQTVSARMESVCPAVVANCIWIVHQYIQPMLLPHICWSKLLPVRFGPALLLLVGFEFLALNPILVGTLHPVEAK